MKSFSIVKKAILIVVFIQFKFLAYTQITEYKPIINKNLLTEIWPAFWITEPEQTAENQYRVCHFRKQFSINEIPKSFIVHVSADNAYRLFVNGNAVCSGPARGDRSNWYFETIDIAPYLRNGTNAIAAVVWNFGIYAPNALKYNVDYQLAFILQGNTNAEYTVNTDKSWKVIRNTAYTPQLIDANISTGANEIVKASNFPWGWELPDYPENSWNYAITLQHGFTYAASNTAWFDRILKPREIPLPIEEPVNLKNEARTSDKSINTNFITQYGKTIVKANSVTTILFDQQQLITAYPELTLSNGKGAKVTITYAEALVDAQKQKGNRNIIDNKTIIGQSDIFYADGGINRLFRPLWYRTYRYLQLNIETGNEPLEINRLTGKFTTYPFFANATFESSNPTLSKIWDVGWHTARLCAHTTYMDCPYYEQLQYVGDTRIQALISLYVSGDDRLMRKAITEFDQSRFPFGLTCSSYPSVGNQIIPPFSLFWVLMVNDYRMLRPDSAFCRGFESGIRQVLAWHKQYLNPDNLLQDVPYWNFVDWPDQWQWVDSLMIGGVPDGGMKGSSSILSLQYAYTLLKASDMFAQWGLVNEAVEYKQTAENIKKGVMQTCWDTKKGLLADSPQKLHYSQHANLWIPLCNMLPKLEQAKLLKKIIADTSLIQTTIYYSFYLSEAMREAGIGNDYMSSLRPWENMLNIGLTTFAERPEPTRSDCHAWSASPLYFMLSLVAGVESVSAGFNDIKIAPHPGSLKYLKASIPHPEGKIELDLKFGNNKVTGNVKIPANVKVTFLWSNKSIGLIEGNNVINL